MQWTEAETAMLREHYPFMTAEALAPIMGRSARAIRQRASALELKKVVHAPKNWRPIGSERMDRGHRVRKVTDTGQPKKDWKRIEVIEWEAIHGPIPTGHMLMVIDSSKPRTTDNLQLYTARSHLDRMTVNNQPPEIAALF
ncbi:MAG: hypothetical protein ACRYGA_17200 [Janthinobacterium lividum]